MKTDLGKLFKENPAIQKYANQNSDKLSESSPAQGCILTFDVTVTLTFKDVLPLNLKVV
jgi:hypothetical protein